MNSASCFRSELFVFSIIAIFACPNLRADDAEASRLRSLAREEIEEGSVIASKPRLALGLDALVVDPGDVRIVGMEGEYELYLRPMQHQLELELLRKYAFNTAQDAAASAPFFENIEKEIAKELLVIKLHKGEPDRLKRELEQSDLRISSLRSDSFQAVAVSRGLKRFLITKVAHPGWNVTFLFDPRNGAYVRYVPYLDYELNKTNPGEIRWATVSNGAVVKLRGRYRAEFVRDGGVIGFRQPSIKSIGTINFN